MDRRSFLKLLGGLAAVEVAKPIIYVLPPPNGWRSGDYLTMNTVRRFNSIMGVDKGNYQWGAGKIYIQRREPDQTRWYLLGDTIDFKLDHSKIAEEILKYDKRKSFEHDLAQQASMRTSASNIIGEYKDAHTLQIPRSRR